MKDEQIISWIFLAIAISSKKSPSEIAEISQIADGINHAVPTEKEMKKSLLWLSKENLISKIGVKYSLSDFGKIVYEKAEAKYVFNIWKNLEIEFRKIMNVA